MGADSMERFKIANDPIGTFVATECTLDRELYETKDRLKARFRPTARSTLSPCEPSKWRCLAAVVDVFTWHLDESKEEVWLHRPESVFNAGAKREPKRLFLARRSRPGH